METKQENDSRRQETDRAILSPWRLGWRSFKRDRIGVCGAVMVLSLVAIALFGSILTPYNPLQMIYKDSFQGPSLVHVMGTDRFGRDQLSRIVVGAETSMIVSFGAVAISTFLGVIIGLLSGYVGGRTDGVIMRLLDVVFAFPTVLLALAAVAAFGPSMVNLILIMGVIFSARFARIVRGSVLSVKEKDFIEAVRSVGAKDATIMFKFILPNVLSPIIVQATFNLSTAIMIEAGLSFLGLGTQPPQPSWGQMLNEARAYMEMAPWLAVFPGIAIIYAVLAFNFFGDGLRDAFDPRLSQR
jgi:peptide/nickel transport system permease protein